MKRPTVQPTQDILAHSLFSSLSVTDGKEIRERQNGHILRGFSISDENQLLSHKRCVLRLLLCVLSVCESIRPILHRGHTPFWWDSGACGYTPIGSNQTPNTCWASGINPGPSPWQWYSTLMGTIHYSGPTTGCLLFPARTNVWNELALPSMLAIRVMTLIHTNAMDSQTLTETQGTTLIFMFAGCGALLCL